MLTPAWSSPQAASCTQGMAGAPRPAEARPGPASHRAAICPTALRMPRARRGGRRSRLARRGSYHSTTNRACGIARERAAGGGRTARAGERCAQASTSQPRVLTPPSPPASAGTDPGPASYSRSGPSTTRRIRCNDAGVRPSSRASASTLACAGFSSATFTYVATTNGSTACECHQAATELGPGARSRALRRPKALAPKVRGQRRST